MTHLELRWEVQVGFHNTFQPNFSQKISVKCFELINEVSYHNLLIEKLVSVEIVQIEKKYQSLKNTSMPQLTDHVTSIALTSITQRYRWESTNLIKIRNFRA